MPDDLQIVREQRDHEERLRRLALRRGDSVAVEFPGRDGAYLSTRGGGNYFNALEYTLDPIPADAGGGGQYTVDIPMPLGGVGLIDERFYLGLWISYPWPTRCEILLSTTLVWEGSAQAALTPDGGAYAPFELGTDAFLGVGPDAHAGAQMALFGPSGASRYGVDGFAFARKGRLYVPDFGVFFGDDRSGVVNLTVTMLDDSLAAPMTEGWAHAYRDASGGFFWPPPMIIHAIAVRMNQDVGESFTPGASGAAVQFDTVEFLDAGFTVAGTPLEDPTLPVLADRVVVPEGGWYRFTAGADCPFIINASRLGDAHDMESASLTFEAIFDGGFETQSAVVPGVLETSLESEGFFITAHHGAGQVSGLLHIPAGGGLVQLLVEPGSGVDQGGSTAPDWEGDGSPVGAHFTGASLDVMVKSAHLALWRYYADEGDV